MHSPLPRRRWSPALLLLLLGACADGGKQTVPESPVKIAANHHLIWFLSLPGFASATSRAAAIDSGHGLLALGLDSNYTVQSSDGTTAPDRYGIAEDGVLSVYRTGSGRTPSTVLLGGYRLVGSEADLCFTDRISASPSLGLGFYLGTRQRVREVTTDEFGGLWHVLSLHVMLTTNTPTLARQVARAAHGTIDIAEGAPGTVRAITNENDGKAGEIHGTESGNDLNPIVFDFTGTIQELLDGANAGDGTCNLTLSYDNIGVPADPRDCFAYAGKDLVLAVDEGEADGEAGLVTLVRAFDTSPNGTPATAAQVAGEWLVGGATVFVSPTNNGTDAFVGTMTLTPQGGFRLDATGHQGIDFAYTGCWTVAPNGRLTVTIPATNETWAAAINRTYDSLVLVDDVVENRANNLPELNLAFAVRKKIN